MDAVTILAGMGLNPDALHLILRKAVISDLLGNTIVLNNGCRSDNLYIIFEGRVESFVVEPNGCAATILLHGSEEYFGGMGFDNVPGSASIMTVEPSRFLILPKSELKAILPKNSPFTARVFERLLHELEEVGFNLAE